MNGKPHYEVGPILAKKRMPAFLTRDSSATLRLRPFSAAWYCFCYGWGAGSAVVIWTVFVTSYSAQSWWNPPLSSAVRSRIAGGWTYLGNGFSCFGHAAFQCFGQLDTDTRMVLGIHEIVLLMRVLV